VNKKKVNYVFFPKVLMIFGFRLPPNVCFILVPDILNLMEFVLDFKCC